MVGFGRHLAGPLLALALTAPYRPGPSGAGRGTSWVRPWSDEVATVPPSSPLHPLSSRPLAAVSASSTPAGRRVPCHFILCTPGDG